MHNYAATLSMKFDEDDNTVLIGDHKYDVLKKWDIKNWPNLSIALIENVTPRTHDFGFSFLIVNENTNKLIFKSKPSLDNVVPEDEVRIIDLNNDGDLEVVYFSYSEGRNKNCFGVLYNDSGEWGEGFIKDGDRFVLADLDFDGQIEVIHKFNKFYLDPPSGLDRIYNVGVYAFIDYKLVRQENLDRYHDFFKARLAKLLAAKQKAILHYANLQNDEFGKIYMRLLNMYIDQAYSIVSK